MNCKERKSYLLPCPVCHEKTDVKIHEDTAVFTTQEENSNTYTGSKPSVSIIPLIWCFGVCLMLCYLVFSYFKMLWLVREAVPEREKIWVCDAVTTPFMLHRTRGKLRKQLEKEGFL